MSHKEDSIKFNMRAVPRSARSDETFVEMVEYYTKKLQDDDWKWALCVHEAGHAVSSERFGYRVGQFEVPLAFEYDPRTESFIFHQAQVLLDVEDDWRQTVWVSLAGPVAERELTPRSAWATKDSYAGDYEDAKDALKQGRVPKRQRASYIKRAESRIRTELRDPALCKAIEQRAQTYLRVLNRVVTNRRSVTQR